MSTAAVSVGVTLVGYLAGRTLAGWMARRKWPPVVHPVAVAFASVILYLRIGGVPYAAYLEQLRPLTFLLGPAIVALALPLHEQAPLLRKRGGFFLAVSLACAFFGAATGYGAARLLQGDTGAQFALMARVATAPLAMAAAHSAQQSGAALPPNAEQITGATAVFCGLVGGIFGPLLLNGLRVRHPVARGAALGAISTSIGTACALEEGEEAGAAAAVTLILTGIAAAVLVPVATRLLGG